MRGGALYCTYISISVYMIDQALLLEFTFVANISHMSREIYFKRTLFKQILSFFIYIHRCICTCVYVRICNRLCMCNCLNLCMIKCDLYDNSIGFRICDTLYSFFFFCSMLLVFLRFSFFLCAFKYKRIHIKF